MFKKIFKGFTLIELLVVIAIIAILAAILFPVFAQAREKARQTSCLSNCKQMGTGIQLYVDDYDETYPIPYLTDAEGGIVTADAKSTTSPAAKWTSCVMALGDNPHRYTWKDAIFPYVKNINMYVCPSFTKCYGYGINTNFEQKTDGSRAIRVVAELKNTAETPFISETQVWDGGGRNQTAPYIVNLDACNAKRHNGGANITFCDGHAHYYKAYSAPYFQNTYNDGTSNVNWGIFDSYWNPEMQQ